MDDILNIGKVLDSREMLKTPLFRSLLQIFRDTIKSDADSIKKLNKRLQFLQPFLTEEPTLFDGNLQSMLLKCIPSSTTTRQKLLHLLDISRICNNQNLASEDTYYDSLLQEFSQMSEPGMTQDCRELYVLIGLTLLKHRSTKIISLLTTRPLFDSVCEDTRLMANMLK